MASEIRPLPAEARDEACWGLCEIRWIRSYRSGAFVAFQQGDPPEEIERSPKFRWRRGGVSPPESPEIASCLESLERSLAVAGWEPVARSDGEWCARQFRRRLVPLSERLRAYAVTRDEGMTAWLDAQTAAPANGATGAPGEDPPRVVGIREAARQRELKRLEAERLEAERHEAERLLARHREFKRLEAERREQERLEALRCESERVEAERLQAERKESWTLGGRLSAYTTRIERQAEIRASFGVEPSRRRTR